MADEIKSRIIALAKEQGITDREILDYALCYGTLIYDGLKRGGTKDVLSEGYALFAVLFAFRTFNRYTQK